MNINTLAIEIHLSNTYSTIDIPDVLDHCAAGGSFIGCWRDLQTLQGTYKIHHFVVEASLLLKLLVENKSKCTFQRQHVWKNQRCLKFFEVSNLASFRLNNNCLFFAFSNKDIRMCSKWAIQCLSCSQVSVGGQKSKTNICRWYFT